MGTNRTRYQPAGAGPESYWRRRFFVLVTGLAILALAAWGFSAVVNHGLAASPAAVTKSSGYHKGRKHSGGHHHHKQSAATPRTTLSPSPSSTAPSTPAPSSSGRAATQNKAKQSKSPAPRRGRSQAAGSPTPRATAHTRSLRSCRSRAVVLSVFASQRRYSASAEPSFEVDVVSTARGDCAFNIGASYLRLVIRSGSHQLWSSACGGGPRSRTVRLARGVPRALAISWDRDLAGRGCAARHGRAPAGWYSATAEAGHLASRSVAFRVG